MSVYRFTVPGHSTRREFAVYIVVARRADGLEFSLYVGKTGDNRAGCNPVISRAGNHFSYNEIHSQVRNKLEDHHLFDYEYFYVTFHPYDNENHRSNVAVINEMERAANLELQSRLPLAFMPCLLNRFKAAGYVGKAESAARRNLMTPERRQLIAGLVDSAVDYVESFNPEFRGKRVASGQTPR
jgi:hypothetical protein